MAIIEKPRTSDDVYNCVKLYYDNVDHKFFQVDLNECVRNLIASVRANKFVRLLREDDKIIAWIYANKIKLQYSKAVVFQQMIYASDQTGIKAYRCIEKLHFELVEEASRQECNMVLAGSNPFDERLTYVRILEKLGWKREGFMAKFPL